MFKEMKHRQFLLALLSVIVLFLLIFTACGGSTSSAKASNSSRVLVINIDYDAAQSKTSDTTQIENALTDGGMIILNPDNLDQTFKDTASLYGASNAEGSYYVLGAILNYTASRGWELVQAPSSGLSSNYYFVK